MKYLSSQTTSKQFRYWYDLKLFVSHIVNKYQADWNPELREFTDVFLKEMNGKGEEDAASIVFLWKN